MKIRLNPFNIDMDYSKLIPLGKLKRVLFIALLVVFACGDKEIAKCLINGIISIETTTIIGSIKVGANVLFYF